MSSSLSLTSSLTTSLGARRLAGKYSITGEGKDGERRSSKGDDLEDEENEMKGRSSEGSQPVVRHLGFVLSL